MPRRIQYCLMTVTLMLGADAARPEADDPDFYAVTGVAADDALHIRSVPDPRAAKVGTIPSDGTCVRNLGYKGGLSFEEFNELSAEQKKERLRQHPRWYKVEYRGITGWVAGRYLVEGYCDQ